MSHYKVTVMVQLPVALGNVANLTFSNFFFQKHQATNLAILKMYLATYSNFWLSDSDNKKAHIFHPNYTKRRTEDALQYTHHVDWVQLLFAIVQFNNNNNLIIVHLWYTLLVACSIRPSFSNSLTFSGN